jgi:ABC-2 type transport system permease protein
MSKGLMRGIGGDDPPTPEYQNTSPHRPNNTSPYLRIGVLSQRGRSPHTASHQGVYVFRPEPLLAAIDPGIDSFFGIATLAEDEQHFFEWKPAEDELAAHRFGEISVASILEFIIPLLLILLLYSTFTHDRETGILRLTMSLGVRRSQYIAGKLIGGLAPILAFAPAILFLLLAMKLLAGDAAFHQAWPALLWMSVGYGLLFATVIFVCLGVSALAPSSRSSLLTLVLLWCVTSFLVPHVATDVAEHLQPTPSAADVLAALDKVVSQGKNRDDLIREIGIELMHKYGSRTSPTFR